MAAHDGTNADRRVPPRRRLLRVLTVGSRTSPLGSRQRRPAGREVAIDFDRFYRSHYPPVTRLAYSLCGSWSIAEELAQEAFVAAHDRWPRVATFDRPDLWVRRVVINRSISYRRKLATERGALNRLPDPPVSSLEPTLADEELWGALRELSPRQAEVLALVYVEDQPIVEVAEILGLGEETVRTHLKRGRSALAVRLGSNRVEVRP